MLNSKIDILDVSDAPLSSCQEHYDQGDRIDGVYTIQVGNIANIILTFINWKSVLDQSRTHKARQQK